MKEKIKELKKLCDHFRANKETFKNPNYDEANTKQEFIDKFFALLDWDMDNSQKMPDEYKEVELEATIIMDGEKPKKPDYSFNIGKERKFFVEAKKPSINIKEAISPAYQVRRYGYSGQLVLSILTDFEEFAVYDTRIEPNQNDNSSIARIFYFTFEDYEKNFEHIYNLFSKKAILDGSFDKYAKDPKNKKGTSRFDKNFLALIENWRKLLATNIAMNNQELDVHSLNHSVQVIIDRIIFLRFAEDKNVEKYGLLKNALSTESIFNNLNKLFLKAHNKYNSGLFEKLKWISDLKINDEVFKTILPSSYFPECPYEFSIMPIEILGNIYEQLLGKIIHIKPSHEIEIEEKEEVKKAGGVVYTPQYIVKYIVQNTVGEKIKKADLANLKLTVLDPACGSGSFLVGVYSFLLEKYLEYYTDKSRLEKSLKNGFIYQVSVNKYLLSIAAKQNILLKHIYGVDIDSQAVEVTKLSLLLKLMEDENTESADRLFKHSDTKLLPDLDNNIKCGNSLIASDFYNDKDLLLFGNEEIRKMNAFDWKSEGIFDKKENKWVNRGFPEIFKEGGFDIVVGNPPYVRQETLGEEFKVYAKSHYKSTFAGTADLYVYFIEKSLSLLANNGYYSIIVANKWMRANYGEALRKFLKTKRIFEIVDFGDLPVFANATTYPCIIKANNDKPKDFLATQVKDLDFTSLKDVIKKEAYQVDVKSLDDKGWSLSNQKESALLDKIKKAGIPLGEYVEGKIYYGIKTGLNEAFVIDEETKERLIKEDSKSAEIIKPFLAGRDVKRYKQPIVDKYLLFTRRGIDIKKYPAILKHLEQFKTQLMPKPKDYPANKEWKGRKPGTYQWYEIQDAVDYYNEFEKEKIIIPAIVQKGSYAFDIAGIYSNDKTSIIPCSDKYLLGVLNSKVSDYFIHRIASTKQGGYYEYKPMYVEKIPIPTELNPPYPPLQKGVLGSSKDKIISLVEQMLSAQKELHAVTNDSNKKLLGQKCELLDKQIDKLVYELYGLTEDEIKIVEGKSA